MVNEKIIKELFMKRQEDIIHAYKELKGGGSISIDSILNNMKDLSETQRKRLSKLLNRYSENKNAECASELEYYYKYGFQDGAKMMLETFGKEEGKNNENI